jgi:hypothetical protein
MPVIGTVFPESREWVGLGRELVTGTVVAPAIVVPVEKAEPDEKPTFLDDKSIRGFMAEEYGLIQGTEFSDFNFNGPVYLNSIGHILLNIFGDYSATGSTPTNSTTFTAPLTVGATTGTLTSAAGYTASSIVQIGTGATAEVVQFTALAGSNATWANNPIRFAHSGTPAASTVVAPFTHTFSLLNSGNGQPVTHTASFFQGISGSFGSRQYGSWCASEAAFTLDAEKLFTHATKGMSFLSAPTTGSALTQVLTSDAAQPVWEAKVGIGGPASGGTQINDVVTADITISRQLKAYWTLSGQQTPYVIGRNGLAIAGKFTEIAQNETPMLNMLNNVQPQVQIVISNGLSGANLLAATFNLQVAAYDTAKLVGNDEIEYQVSFKGIANTTNQGGSAGYSPGNVIIQNAIPTY